MQIHAVQPLRLANSMRIESEKRKKKRVKYYTYFRKGEKMYAHFRIYVQIEEWRIGGEWFGISIFNRLQCSFGEHIIH